MTVDKLKTPHRYQYREKKNMATVKPQKSILKQPKTPVATPDQETSQPTDEETKSLAEAAALKKRHLDIAIKHALLIEHQRKTSDQVLKHIELLLDFPPSSSPTPTPSDATSFLRLVEIFQPSNFDELVEERRIDARCAYPLCSNEPRGLRLKDSETWKLKKGAGNWCSDACARKGLFVKAQLGEVPAWERVPGQQAPIVLHEDDRHLVQGADGVDGEEDDARVKQQQQQQQHVQQRVAERTELAMERGEKVASVRPDQVMTDFIVEKTLPMRPAQTASKVRFASATAIEGYEPKTDLTATSANESLISDSIALPAVAEIAAMLNIPGQNADAKKTQESDNESATEDEDDEDQQWKDMFENMKKRG
jgi:hypothetical protein